MTTNPTRPFVVPSVDEELKLIRGLGWSVAVHNDYRLDGRHHPFWLFPKGDPCAQTECPTGDEPLALHALRTRLAARPSPPGADAGEVEAVTRAIDRVPSDDARLLAQAPIQAIAAYRSTTPPSPTVSELAGPVRCRARYSSGPDPQD